jgi:hypothetical protein
VREPDLITGAADVARKKPARNVSQGAPRMRIGRLVFLLLVSAVLFVAVVAWQRDQARMKSALEAAVQVRDSIQRYLTERGHLPFELRDADRDRLAPPEIPYLDRTAIYRLKDVSTPYVLVAGPRQGLLPPRPAGSAAIFFDKGTVRVEWLLMDRVEQERKKRDDLLAASPIE